MKKLQIFLLCTVLSLINGPLLAQCAMCKGSVESNMSTGRDVIANGINAGIAYLFAFPYLSVAIIGFLWYRKSKKNLQERMLLQKQIPSN